MSRFASDRNERRRRLEQLLLAERDEAYGAALRAGVEAVARYATEQAGTRGMTATTRASLRNCLAALAAAARHAAADGTITHGASEALVEHARQAEREAVERLGERKR